MNATDSTFKSECKYHFKEQNRSGEVGVLFEVPDYSSLNNLTATFHYQTGRGNCGQLVGFHVSQAPSQDLGSNKHIKTFIKTKTDRLQDKSGGKK